MVGRLVSRDMAGTQSYWRNRAAAQERAACRLDERCNRAATRQASGKPGSVPAGLPEPSRWPLLPSSSMPTSAAVSASFRAACIY